MKTILMALISLSAFGNAAFASSKSQPLACNVQFGQEAAPVSAPLKVQFDNESTLEIEGNIDGVAYSVQILETQPSNVAMIYVLDIAAPRIYFASKIPLRGGISTVATVRYGKQILIQCENPKSQNILPTTSTSDDEEEAAFSQAINSESGSAI